MTQCILGDPFFAGESEIDQIFKIFRFLGTPTNETWPGVTLLENFFPSFPNWSNIDIRNIASETALEKIKIESQFNSEGRKDY